MKVAFRTDASVDVGTGHVARCTSLATQLRARGAQCTFACRALPGDRRDLLETAGFPVLTLPADTPDADATIDALLSAGLAPNALVVDHYELDAVWEQSVARATGADILCVDDLANRPHACTMLLDQNFYICAADRYRALVPKDCRQLLGPRYALLRQEFATLRATLERSAAGVERVLIFFGGIDAKGAGVTALRAVLAARREGVRLDLVAGRASPHLDELDRLCSTAPGVELHIETARMAELMAAADLCVGAGGTATWERCCLGLPTIAISVADNQEECLSEMGRVGLLHYLGRCEEVGEAAIAEAFIALAADVADRSGLSRRCMEVTDGKGADVVADILLCGNRGL